jgi:hypothetical protein
VVRAISGIIFENQVVFLKIRGPRLDFGQVQGVLCKVPWIFPARDLFSNEKAGGPGPRRGCALLACSAQALRQAGASRWWRRRMSRTRWCRRGAHQGTRAAERRRDEGEDRRWLELSARAKEGSRELGREGKRGGEG